MIRPDRNPHSSRQAVLDAVIHHQLKDIVSWPRHSKGRAHGVRISQLDIPAAELCPTITQWHAFGVGGKGPIQGDGRNSWAVNLAHSRGGWWSVGDCDL